MTLVQAQSTLAGSRRTLWQIAAGFLAQYGPNTRDSYQDALTKWFYWLEQRNVDPLAVSRPHIDLWGRYLAEVSGHSPSTVQQRLSVLRSFYRYVQELGLIADSPAANVKLPKVANESRTQRMMKGEVAALIEAAQGNRTHLALCLLLALNGLRISEAVECDVSDLGYEAGYRTLTVTRKGGKRQAIPLSDQVATAIDTMLLGRQMGPLFLGTHNQRLSRTAAGKVIARIGQSASLSGRVHPHRLRHAFATMALDAGVPLHDVQDSMGHATPATTQRYNRARNRLEKNATHAVANLFS